jgi:7-cyano-7-deazaguanine synthase
VDKPKAIVLLSGGLDSTTVLAIAKSEGYSIYALTFDYGQRHRIEVQRAEDIADLMKVSDHLVAVIDLRVFTGSALTSTLPVPKSDSVDGIGGTIPVTYVGARNAIFLSYALGYAEALGASDIFIGVNAVDYSGYPDCRPEFIAAFQRMADLATRVGVLGRPITINAPLLALTKAEIINWGMSLHIPYSITHSCYDPTSRLACGRCDSCLLRIEGFSKAGYVDPTEYVERPYSLTSDQIRS